MNVNHADNPILTARVVVDGRAIEMHLGPAKSASCLAENFGLAYAHGFLLPEPMVIAAIVVAALVVGAILPVVSWTVRLIVAVERRVAVAGIVWGVIIHAAVVLSASIPGEIKGITFGASIGIFDTNDGDSAVSWIAG